MLFPDISCKLTNVADGVQDVNQCQIAIRRSFATEFSAGGTSGGASSGVDMIGDGKSRLMHRSTVRKIG